MGVRDVLLPVTACPTALPGTPQYTYGATNNNSKMSVRLIRAVNRDSSAHPVTIHHTTGGAAAENGNIIWPAVSVPANTMVKDCYDVGEMVMKSGDALYIFSDSALVNFYVSGEADE